MASAANGAGLVDEETWQLVEGNKKAKVAKVATVVDSIKQTLSTPVRVTRQNSAPVTGNSTPKAGTSTPRKAHSGLKPPATTPKGGGGGGGQVPRPGHPPTLLTPKGAGAGGGGPRGAQRGR